MESDEQVKKVPITAADGKIAGGCRVDASFNIYPVCWTEISSSFTSYYIQGEGNFHVGIEHANNIFGGVSKDLKSFSEERNNDQHSHAFSPEDLKQFNCSHVIDYLSFGPAIAGEPNTLDKYEKNMGTGKEYGCYHYNCYYSHNHLQISTMLLIS